MLKSINIACSLNLITATNILSGWYTMKKKQPTGRFEPRHIKINFETKPLQNAPFCPIPASGSNFNPQNTICIPVVKIFAFLGLEQNWTFFKGFETWAGSVTILPWHMPWYLPWSILLNYKYYKGPAVSAGWFRSKGFFPLPAWRPEAWEYKWKDLKRFKRI